MGYIYLITNNVNGKSYVGQTSSKYVSIRWGNHRAEARRRKNHPLYNSINKYGIDNFSFEVLLEDVSDDELDYYERLWISKLNTLIPNGYNIANGGTHLKGEDNPMHGKTPWNKGIPLSEEAKINLSDKFTEERKSKQSDAIKSGEHPFSKTNGKNTLFKGKKHKKESISSNALSQKNRKSVVMINKDTNEEIMCFVSLGQASKYIKENTKYIKADYATINKVCKGINKSAYGYCWKFAEI